MENKENECNRSYGNEEAFIFDGSNKQHTVSRNSTKYQRRIIGSPKYEQSKAENDLERMMHEQMRHKYHPSESRSCGSSPSTSSISKRLEMAESRRISIEGMKLAFSQNEDHKIEKAAKKREEDKVHRAQLLEKQMKDMEDKTERREEFLRRKSHTIREKLQKVEVVRARKELLKSNDELNDSGETLKKEEEL
ncbi:hypothetical protein SNEBB_008100 [Seison nebaliae]|nr:hypothetical protein SNEBB_008100 [Seison nebaliae]